MDEWALRRALEDPQVGAWISQAQHPSMGLRILLVLSKISEIPIYVTRYAHTTGTNSNPHVVKASFVDILNAD